MSIASSFILNSFDYDEYKYHRPSEHQIIRFGGRCIESSNDNAGNSGWSFSPTEVWEFPDGSRMEVGYSLCEEIHAA
jgi:hypothetical protein